MASSVFGLKPYLKSCGGCKESYIYCKTNKQNSAVDGGSARLA